MAAGNGRSAEDAAWAVTGHKARKWPSMESVRLDVQEFDPGLTPPVSDTVPILRVHPRVALPGPTKIDSVRVATPPDASRCLSVFKTPSL